MTHLIKAFLAFVSVLALAVVFAGCSSSSKLESSDLANIHGKATSDTQVTLTQSDIENILSGYSGDGPSRQAQFFERYTPWGGVDPDPLPLVSPNATNSDIAAQIFNSWGSSWGEPSFFAYIEISDDFGVILLEAHASSTFLYTIDTLKM